MDKIGLEVGATYTIYGNDLDFETKVTLSDISKQVAKLIKYSSSINYKTTDYLRLENSLIIYFNRLVSQRQHLDLLKSYFNENGIKEEKIVSKLEKNIMIYLPIITEYVYSYKDINHVSDIEPIIKEAFKKMFILLFIYGDKTSLSLFSKLMKFDLFDLKERESEFIDNQLLLQEKEKESISSFIDIPIESRNTTFLKDDIYSRTYRSIFEKTDEKYIPGGSKTREEILIDTTKREVDSAINGLYKLFLKTIELNTDLEMRIKKLANSFINIVGLIEAFKEIGILNKDFSVLANKKYNNNYFGDFLLIIKSGKYDFSDFINKISGDSHYNNLDLHKSEEIEDEDFESIKLQGINKNLWLSLNTNQKYLFFINKVLCFNKGEIKIGNALRLTHLSIKTLSTNFSKVYGYNKDFILKKIEYFKSKKSFKLTDFIQNDLDSFIFLYEWWEFIISDGKISGRPSFIVDFIKDLKKDKKIKDDFEIKTDGELYNLSAVNIGLQINFIFNDLSRGNIDLSKFKIGKHLFKDTSSFYLESEKSNIEDSLNYLNVAIDGCINVLNGKDLTDLQLNYIRILQDLEILPINLARIENSAKDRIIKLIPGLKLVKLKIEILNKMQEVSKSDMELVGNIFTQIGIDVNLYDKRIGNSIGPYKDFGRIISKLVKSYSGDFHKIGDLNRFRLVGKLNSGDTKGIKEILLDVLNLKNNNYVLDISLENSAGHLLSNPDKSSGYRDFKANILLVSGNVVELQIHFDEMITAKSGSISISNNTKKLLEKNFSLLTTDEVGFFIEQYYINFGKYPSSDLILNISNLNESELSSFNIGEGKINCDMLYKISRSIDNNSSIKTKLVSLERIFFNTQWSNVIIKNLEKIGVDFKEDHIPKIAKGKSKKT